MKIEYDTTKNEANILKRNISFELVRNFNFDTALTLKDLRHHYDETRFISTGYIKDRLYVLVFTPRNEVLRVISLRKANVREIKKYEHYSQTKP